MPDFFAFDFDGVICDSVGETAMSAWRAAQTLWPTRFFGDIDLDLLARFCNCRPVIESGFENFALLDLLDEGVSEREILENFEALSRKFMDDGGYTADQLKELFGRARDAWADSDEADWLAAQGFFPGVVETINACNTPRCVITTKQERFAKRLATMAGLDVPPERIYGLESLGGSKRNVLVALQEEFPGHIIHFFEDRYPTQLRLTDLKGVRLYLVDWGYNTHREREAAAEHPDITLLDKAGFAATISR